MRRARHRRAKRACRLGARCRALRDWGVSQDCFLHGGGVNLRHWRWRNHLGLKRAALDSLGN